MARCEDYPCCGHTDGLGCDYTPDMEFIYAHAGCDHEVGDCWLNDVDEDEDEDESEPEASVTLKIRWAAGWNMGGYSPDPDNVYITDDYSSALEYVKDTIERWWDSDYVADETDEERLATDGRYLDIHTTIHNWGTVPREFSEVVPDRNGYGWTFWIIPTDEEPDND